MTKMLELTRYLQAGNTTISNLLLNHYHDLGMSHQEFILYMKLMQHQQQGVPFPDLLKIAEQMGESAEIIFHLVESLLNKNIIAMVTTQNEQGQTSDSYDLTLVYGRLSQLETSKAHQVSVKNEQEQQRELFQLFESEFGRPLSPMELETIGLWIHEDQYKLEIIQLALREAVLNQAYSLKYIDRILLNWERKNLRSKEQIISEQQKRKKALGKNEQPIYQESQDELPIIPMDNWLSQT